IRGGCAWKVKTLEAARNRAAECERKSGGRRTFQVGILAIDYRMPESGFILQANGRVELTCQSRAHHLELATEPILAHSRSQRRDHLRRRDRKPAIAARPQALRVSLAIHVSDVPAKPARVFNQVAVMHDQLIKGA